MTYPLTLSSGQQVGPYTILSPLRAGGMATLYLAWRKGPAGFGRPVALKVVHTHLSRAPQFARMFVDEALLCARIRHPNVVHVEELGEHEGAYYLAMEYVDGASVEDLLDRLCAAGERLPVAMAVSIAGALLEGLYAAHTLRGDEGELLGVVHRDVSPSNALVDRAGHVKLIDFGVAKARGRAFETGAGTLKGKFAYMSPEQASGRPVDQRSDVYSLAVMLWEMLAMRPLFVADTDLALLALVRAPKVVSLRDLRPDVSPSLEQVLLRALQREPSQRPEHARELRRLLLDACPEARSIDASELATLVARLMGPVRAFDAIEPFDAGELGSTVSSAVHATNGPTPVANEGESQSARVARPAPRKARLLLAIALVAATSLGIWGRTLHGAIAAWRPPSARAVAASSRARPTNVEQSLVRPRLQADSSVEIFARRPGAIVPEAGEGMPTALLHRKKVTSIMKPAGPKTLGGVPIVAEPPF